MEYYILGFLATSLYQTIKFDRKVQTQLRKLSKALNYKYIEEVANKWYFRKIGDTIFNFLLWWAILPVMIFNEHFYLTEYVKGLVKR